MDDLQRRLRDAIARHRVPGASLAVLHGNQSYRAVAGVLNTRNAWPVTPDAMFQIGSITKVFTACLAMGLVDRGLLDLDRPIGEYLGEFRLGDSRAAAQITMRHLLTHTSGIEGDFFVEAARGDDCLRDYLEQCMELPQLFQVGERFSYCNTGYVIAGRVIEVLSGLTWDQAMRDRIFLPLAMANATTLAEDLVGRPAAIGHSLAVGGDIYIPLPKAYALPLAIGPAGSTATMSAEDLLKFVTMHLSRGKSPDGQQVLSAESVGAMQVEQLKLPGPVSMTKESWGLGWSLSRWDGEFVYGHDGNTDGQRAFLRVVPNHQAALVLLTNGGAGIDLAEELLNEIFGTLLGLAPLHPSPVLSSCPGSLPAYTGRYAHPPGYTEIREEQGCLVMYSVENAGDDNEEVASFRLSPVDLHLFASIRPPNNSPWYVQFLDFDGAGKAQTLFSLYRMCKREDGNG